MSTTMSVAAQGFRIAAARSYSCRPVCRHHAISPIGLERAFTTSSTHMRRIRPKAALAKLRASDEPLAREVAAMSEEILRPTDDDMDRALDPIKLRSHNRYPPPNVPERAKRPKRTFMNDNDPEPWEYDDTLDDDHDDINTLGHGELEQHREIRHYARLAAWEMPMLSKLAKPFQAPTRDMPLRFRYTTYMGEQHPAEKKVVLEFVPEDMPDLTPIQIEKLKKMVGVRYNPHTQLVKMSCEMFETQAQNKRYLGDIVDSLLVEARDPTDTFEDVPLDTRHVRHKIQPKLPEEWKLTRRRKSELEQYRQQSSNADTQKAISGQLIDGVLQIEEGLKTAAAARKARLIPEMVMAGAENVKGKRISLRR